MFVLYSRHEYPLAYLSVDFSASSATEAIASHGDDSSSDSSISDDCEGDSFRIDDEDIRVAQLSMVDEDVDSNNDFTDSESISTSSDEESISQTGPHSVTNDPVLIHIRLSIKRTRQLIATVRKSSLLTDYVRRQNKEKQLAGEVRKKCIIYIALSSRVPIDLKLIYSFTN